MTQPKRKPRLNDDQRKVLVFLEKAMKEHEGVGETDYLDGYVHVIDLQRAMVWPIRPVLDSLRKRQLVNWVGSQQDLAARHWKITDAGREAIS